MGKKRRDKHGPPRDRPLPRPRPVAEPEPAPTQDQALDVLLSVTAELSAAGCADVAVMGAVLMLGANSAGLMAASSPGFLEDLRDEPSTQPLAGHIYRSCQALLELYEAGVAGGTKAGLPARLTNEGGLL